MTRRLEVGPLLVTLGALVLLVSLFLDWYDPGVTAWEAFEVWDVVLLVLALGCIVAGIGLAVPDLDVIDRRWLPFAVGAVTVIALTQVLDPPPAVAGRDPDLGGLLALGAALIMCAGGLLTFGRVGVAFTLEGRDPRRRVEAVDARGPADPVTNSTEAVAEPAGRGGRLFARDAAPRASDSAGTEPAAVTSETAATEPVAPAEGNAPPAENKE